MSRDEESVLSPSPKTFHKPHDEGEGYEEKLKSAKLDYETLGTSARKLSAQYHIPRNKLNKIIKLENWTKYGSSQGSAKNKMAQTAPHADIFGTIAKRKMQEVREELGEHYSQVDEPLIIVFAKTFERYIDLERTLMNEGEVLESEKTGGKYLNPTFTALQAVQKSLLTYANQLGLSMTSRKLLGIKLGGRDKKSEKSLFDIASDINSMSVEI